jgi:hypothetical protein
MKTPLHLFTANGIKKIILLAFFAGHQVSISWGQNQSVEITPTSTTTTTESTINETVIRSSGVANILGLRFGGTLLSPTTPPNNQPLFQINAGGYNGSAFTTARANISLSATEAWSPTANGTRVSFGTTANGTTSPSTRLTIDHNGFVGIGTLSPESKLHISNGSSGVTPSENAGIFAEDNDHTYINLGTPDNKESGILFGKPSFGGASGGIIYDADRSLLFRTSTNDTRMVVTEAGNVGIGTTTPAAKLDIVGDVRVSLIVTTANTSVSYDPFNRQNNSYHVLNTAEDATVFIRGFTAASAGTLLYLIVAGDGTTILQDNNGTNSADRISTSDNENITISGQGSATFIYTDGWRVLSFTK